MVVANETFMDASQMTDSRSTPSSRFQEWYDNLGQTIPHGHAAQMRMAWEAALRSDTEPKLCPDCGCELECVKHGCAKKYAEHRDAVLERALWCFRWDRVYTGIEVYEKLRALKGNAAPQAVDSKGTPANVAVTEQPAESAFDILVKAKWRVEDDPDSDAAVFARELLRVAESASPFVATGEFGPIGETTPAIVQEWTPPAQRCVGVPMGLFWQTADGKWHLAPGSTDPWDIHDNGRPIHIALLGKQVRRGERPSPTKEET